MKHVHLTYLFFFLSWSILLGQTAGANCENAIEIDKPASFCSGTTQYNNENTGFSDFQATSCFTEVQHDVFFTFIAEATAVNVVVNATAGGSLNRPRLALYQGSCSDVPVFALGCEAVQGGQNVVNVSAIGLTVGEQYIIRVGGEGDNQGSFQLCVNNYNPPIEPGQDGDSAAVLCDKTGFVIQTLTGGGQDDNEAAGTCLDVGFGSSENQSSWTSWIAGNDGTLTFTITPINFNDDIDFVLYELPNGIDDYSGRIVLRCMASGCQGGPTGLNETSTDVMEPAGCPTGNDNFVKALDMEAGKAYALLINNWSNTGVGISVDFGGTGEFVGPDPDFSIVVDDVVNPQTGLICDKQFEVVDNSNGGLGNIINYKWNFGEDAIPQTASGVGPFNVEYATIGEKYITLEVASDLGCVITEIREITVESCCSMPEDLTLQVADLVNIGCEPGSKGSFAVEGNGGVPFYLYSFNGSAFGALSDFQDLEIGDYEVAVMDRKGCETVETVSIVEAIPIEVDAGPDASVEFLGDAIMLNGSYISDNNVTISWTPADEILCDDGSLSCLNPVVTPIGTTIYTLIVMDDEGCTVSDEVEIEVLNVRPLYAPTIFSPNEDGFNDVFTLSGNPIAIKQIVQFNIYDRWGNQVYSGRNLTAADLSEGWDGTNDGEALRSGVYIWFAEIEYIDPETSNVVVSGDVTLLR